MPRNYMPSFPAKSLFIKLAKFDIKKKKKVSDLKNKEQLPLP